MKRTLLLSTTLIVFGGFSGIAQADSFMQTQNGGLQIDETSQTKTLVPIGAVSSDTAVYTDTAGLYPDVNISEVRNRNGLESYASMKANLNKSNNVSMEFAGIAPAAGVSEVVAPVDPQTHEFDLIDENDDGLITETEFFLSVLEPDHQALFDTYDVDGNNAIDIKEFGSYYQAHYKG
jgi:hypothetical protein